MALSRSTLLALLSVGILFTLLGVFFVMWNGNYLNYSGGGEAMNEFYTGLVFAGLGVILLFSGLIGVQRMPCKK